MEGNLEVTNPNQKEGISFPTPLHPAFPENTMVVVTAVEVVVAAALVYAPGTVPRINTHWHIESNCEVRKS